MCNVKQARAYERVILINPNKGYKVENVHDSQPELFLLCSSSEFLFSFFCCSSILSSPFPSLPTCLPPTLLPDPNSQHSILRSPSFPSTLFFYSTMLWLVCIGDIFSISVIHWVILFCSDNVSANIPRPNQQIWECIFLLFDLFFSLHQAGTKIVLLLEVFVFALILYLQTHIKTDISYRDTVSSFIIYYTCGQTYFLLIYYVIIFGLFHEDDECLIYRFSLLCVK